MLGRHVFMDSLVAHGVNRIFGNPGTTESPLIDSLADYPGIEYVVALHEGVALGAASYYAQASGITGVVNLHVAPGLGNAIGMLYCALKANSPMIVTAGQQDTRMRLHDPVLGHDLAAMAAPVTKWSVQAESADELALLMHRAIKIAHTPPAGPVFIALPINVMEQDTNNGALAASPLHLKSTAAADGLSAIAATLARAEAPAIVVGDDVARTGAGDVVTQVAERIGASIWFEGLRGHAAVASAHPNVRRSLPVDAAAIAKTLQFADVVLLVGGPFFEDVWYAPGLPFAAHTRVVQIEESAERLGRNFALDAGAVGALQPSVAALMDALPAQTLAASGRNETLAAEKQSSLEAQTARVERAAHRQPMPMSVVMAELAAAVPDETIVVDESITASIDLAASFQFRGAGDFYSGRGGGIGQGLPGALGVQLARPDRPVLCVSGDGSAMYSIQALWSAAHHALPIVYVILANREYRILKHNLDSYRQRFETGSNRPYAQMDLGAPALGFVEMAAGMGVAGRRVADVAELREAIAAAFASGQPYLIEVEIEGKR